MNAIVYHAYGSPDVLELREVDRPTPRDDEVLIRVRASSVSSWDWDLLRGKPLLARLGGLRTPRYEILGADVAGIIEAVGSEATRFAVGDAVYGDLSGSGWGGFAEYVCAREAVLAAKPMSLNFEEAAAAPQAAVLALQGLRKGRIERGHSVLINGAGGGVGTFGVQLAKSYGAVVTAVDSAGKLDLLRSIGADHVLDYRTADFTESGRSYDLILDVVANRSVFDYRRSLTPTGRFVCIGGSGGTIAQVVFLGSLMSVAGSRKIGILAHRPNVADLEILTGMFDAGELAPVIDRSYPLAEIRDAFRSFGTGLVRGKVVITTYG